MNQLCAVEDSLNSAEGWGTWDLIGGGLISGMAKHSHLDDAQAGAEQLQILLSRFRSELADVKIEGRMGQVNVDGFLRFADYFFDGLIADWCVLSRIADSQESISQVKLQLSSALEKLSRLSAALHSEKLALESEISKLVHWA